MENSFSANYLSHPTKALVFTRFVRPARVMKGEEAAVFDILFHLDRLKRLQSIYL
jgi:hypothetical protein